MLLAVCSQTLTCSRKPDLSSNPSGRMQKRFNSNKIVSLSRSYNTVMLSLSGLLFDN